MLTGLKRITVRPRKASPVAESGPAAATRATCKLKIGAIKLLFIEVGPFEWELAPLDRSKAPAMFCALLAAGAVLAYSVHFFMIRPSLNEFRDRLRIGDYQGAVEPLKATASWTRALPHVDQAFRIGAFAGKLASGQHIRALAPELARLNAEYPTNPDVLVFMGINAYFVEASPSKARDYFERAVKEDPAHAEAHMQAVARYVDEALIALSAQDGNSAKIAATRARQFVDHAAKFAPVAATLPRYSSYYGELEELEGNYRAAYDRYKANGALDPLSALQAALLAWRLDNPASAFRDSQELLETAVARIGAESPTESEGWVFRVSGTEAIDVRAKADKLCLFYWTQKITGTLASPTATVDGNPYARPAACQDTPAGKRVTDIICVQVVSAQAALPSSDLRLAALQAWRSASHLACAPAQEPLPRLTTART